MRKAKPVGLQWAATGQHEMAYYECGNLAAANSEVMRRQFCVDKALGGGNGTTMVAWVVSVVVDSVRCLDRRHRYHLVAI
jgi:hypothetical protein